MRLSLNRSAFLVTTTASVVLAVIAGLLGGQSMQNCACWFPMLFFGFIYAYSDTRIDQDVPIIDYILGSSLATAIGGALVVALTTVGAMFYWSAEQPTFQSFVLNVLIATPIGFLIHLLLGGMMGAIAYKIAGQPKNRARKANRKTAHLIFLWNIAPWTRSDIENVIKGKQSELGCPVNYLDSVQVTGLFPTEPDTFVVTTTLLACQKAGIPFNSQRDQIAYKGGMRTLTDGVGLITIIINP